MNSMSPLDLLVSRDTPTQVAVFAHGASVVRAAMLALPSERYITVAPLRGAMPIVWAAEGMAAHEGRPATDLLEVPIGEFRYVNDEGAEATASPTKGQKHRIMKSALQNRLEERGSDPSKTSLAIIDEVQKGGTLSTAVEILRSRINHEGLMPNLKVVAAQDSRKKVAGQSKTSKFRDIASNSVPFLQTTVVPLPLVGTDRDGLLDTVRLEGRYEDRIPIEGGLSVERNTAAEELFRSIGTMGRDEEVRHDKAFISGLIGAHEISDRVSERIEWWMGRLAEDLDRLDREDPIHVSDRS